MYAFSFAFLIIQYTIADVIHVEMLSPTGVSLKPAILNQTNIESINAVTLDIQNTNFSNVVDAAFAAAHIAWDLFLLMTGAYTFNVLILLGVPEIVVLLFVFIYWALLARAGIAYIRGV